MSWLANKIDDDRQQVTRWLQGVSTPRDDSVWDRMLGVLNLSDVAEPRPTAVDEMVEISLWPPLPADGNWDDLDSITDFVEVPSFLARRRKRPGEMRAPERFAATIRGDSMRPRLNPGDLIIFEANQSPQTGRIVVARSGSKATVKVLGREGSGDLVLQPINPDSGEVIPLTSEIVGFVVAILRDYHGSRGSIEWDDGGVGP